MTPEEVIFRMNREIENLRREVRVRVGRIQESLRVVEDCLQEGPEFIWPDELRSVSCVAREAEVLSERLRMSIRTRDHILEVTSPDPTPPRKEDLELI